jgi:hypothetical protein
MKQKNEKHIGQIIGELLLISLITLATISLVSCANDSSIAPKPVAAAAAEDDADPDPVAVASGTITGTITNAQNNSAISGVLVYISGSPAISATTDNNGDYTLNYVDTGSVTVVAGKTGYTSATKATTVADATTTSNIDLALVQNSYATSKYIITLEWAGGGGIVPEDLDIHLYAPDVTDDGGSPYDECAFSDGVVGATTCHIKYNKKGDNDGTLDNQPFAGLDNDEKFGYGPETLAIWNNGSGTPKSNKTYTLSINNYSSDPNGDNDNTVLTDSAAIVKVYEGDSSGSITLLETVTVPTTGTGDWWHVCNMTNGTWDCSVSVIGSQPAQNADN